MYTSESDSDFPVPEPRQYKSVPRREAGVTLDDLDDQEEAMMSKELLLITLVTIIVVEAIAILVSPGSLAHLLRTFVIFIIVALCTIFYGLGARHESRHQIPDEPQRKIRIYKYRIPLRALKRVLVGFKEDPRSPGVLNQVVFLITRRHRFFPIRDMAATSVVAILVLVVMQRESSLPGLLAVAVVCAWLLATSIIWLVWSSFYLVITDKGVFFTRIYPPFFFWLGVSKDELPRRKIDVVSFVQPLRARIMRLNYGIVKSDTAATGDEKFNKLNGMPNPSEIQHLLLLV